MFIINTWCKKMQDLKIPIAIPAVDLKDSEKYVFTNVEKREENCY